jgi:hypothetical protein
MDDAAQAIEALKERNRTINAGENAGNADILRPLLCTGQVDSEPAAPLLAFRRASGKCEGAKAFLEKVKSDGDRKVVGDREIGDIEVRLLGRHRAVVTCVIETGGKQYHNVRLFVRADPKGQDWKLLGWANEEVLPD